MKAMLMVALLFAQSVDLGSAFANGDASAERISTDKIEVTLTVDSLGGGSVVAHLVDPGGEQLTVAMGVTPDGSHQTTFETRPIDLVVVFEAIGEGQTSVQSAPLRLTQLGLDAALLTTPVFPLDVPTDDTGDWLWLALAAGAGALALLLIAYAPKRRPAEPAQSEPDPADVSD